MQVDLHVEGMFVRKGVKHSREKMAQLWSSYMLCFSWEKENLQKDEEEHSEVWRCYGATCDAVLQVLQEGERHSKD